MTAAHCLPVPPSPSVDTPILPTSPCNSSEKRSMDAVSSRDAKKPRLTKKCVTFVDAQVVWFDKELPPITRFGGLNRPTSPTHSEVERKSRELVDDGTISLTQVHASELRDMIQHVMWGLDLPCKCDDIDTLRKQFNFANDLHLEAMMEFGDFVPDTLAPSSSRRLLLACKDMVGFRGMGYTFGHRFLTIDEFIATMDDIELVRVLQHHQVPVPPFVIPKQDGRHFPTSVLVSRHYMCGGRTLDQLNMVELRLECSIRNVLGAVMSKKYKKKAQLVRLLKPLFEAEHITRCAEMQQRAQMELLVANILQQAATSKMLLSLAKVLRRRMHSHLLNWTDENDGNMEAAPSMEILTEWFAKLLQGDPNTRCPCGNSQ